jgi:hypothetical protein
MNLNLNNFKAFVKKATLSGSIDSLHINLTEDRIKSKMRSSDAISILDLPNNILTDFGKDKGEYDLYFSDPKLVILPYISLFGDEVSISIKDNYIELKNATNKSKIYTCHPNLVSIFNHSAPNENLTYFISQELNDDFLGGFKRIKDVASRFGKMYIGVEDKMLYMEASDKTNMNSNSLKIDLWPIDYMNCNLCFNYKSLNSLIATLDGNYNLEISYVPEQELGMMAIHNEDKSESYFLLSKSE